MTSREALEELKNVLATNPGTKKYADIFEENLLQPIEKDLEVSEKVWDKTEELLQKHLTNEIGVVPYDVLNRIKVNVLKELKEWLEDDK